MFSAHYIEQRRRHPAEQTVQLSKAKLLDLGRILKLCRFVFNGRDKLALSIK